jgi:hypothetical protein
VAEPFRTPVRQLVKLTACLFATPVERAVPPIASIVDNPPVEILSARRVRRAST